MSTYEFTLQNVDGQVRVCDYREDDGHFKSDRPSPEARPFVIGLAEMVKKSGIKGLKIIVTTEETK